MLIKLWNDDHWVFVEEFHVNSGHDYSISVTWDALKAKPFSRFKATAIAVFLQNESGFKYEIVPE